MFHMQLGNSGVSPNSYLGQYLVEILPERYIAGVFLDSVVIAVGSPRVVLVCGIGVLVGGGVFTDWTIYQRTNGHGFVKYAGRRCLVC